MPSEDTFGVLLGLALLVVALMVIAGKANATDVPTNANVNGAEANVEVENAGTLRFCVTVAVGCAGGSNDHAEWDDMPAAGMVELAFQQGDGSLTFDPPTGDHPNDLCRVDTAWDNSASIQRTWRNAATCPPGDEFYQVHCTSDGTATGESRSGTIRIRLRVRDATPAGVDLYNLDSDARAGTSSAGALRCPLAVSGFAHNGYPTGSTHAYTVAGEAIGFTITHTRANADQTSRATSMSSLSSTDTNIQSNTVSLSSGGTTTSTTYTVSDTYPAAATQIGWKLEVTGNSGLTGVKWAHRGSLVGSPALSCGEFCVLRSSFVSLDARITSTHLLRLNDNTFATPPTSEADCCTRLTSDLGFFAVRLTNARGEGLVGASVALTQTIADVAGLASPQTCPGQGIATQGGEAGWGPYCTWTATLPVGTWRKAVDVTAPSSIDNNAHLVNDDQDYVLIGANPDLASTIMYELRQATGLRIEFFTTTASEGSLVSLDDDPPPRFFLTAYLGEDVQHLTAEGSWETFDGAADRRQFQPGQPGVWSFTFPVEEVVTWGDRDFTVSASASGAGAPVFAQAQVANVVGTLSTSSLEVETAFDGWGPAFMAVAVAIGLLFTSAHLSRKWPLAAIAIAVGSLLLLPLTSDKNVQLLVIVAAVVGFVLGAVGQRRLEA